MNARFAFARKVLIHAIACLYGAAQAAALSAAPTQVHNEPLSNAASSVPPNLMFILDDSGSMAWDYTPDYVDDNLCRDDSDSDESLDGCQAGDPPYSSPRYNFQWYNPAITYTPGYDPSLPAPAPGTDYNMQSFNTPALWQAVERDPYSSNNPSGTTNVVVGNTDVVYCRDNGYSGSQLFDTSRCREPVDHSITPAPEAAGTGVWRYPNDPVDASPNGSTDFAYTETRTGSTSRPVPPYFYTVSQVLFCVNRNGNTNSTLPDDGDTMTKALFGKGSTTDATDRCHVRRFNDGTANYQYPRFGIIPHNANNDTRSHNTQEGGTLGDPRKWAGMSGFRKHQIVETSSGSNTLPAGYPSRSDPNVYSERLDCSGGPCTYTQEMTNYANWYAYYRTRMLTMKTVAGKAFFRVDDKFRVGFITINPGYPVSSSRYLPLRTFGAAHKADWYAKFYDQGPIGGTPLREALSRVGRHYAGKTDRINSGMNFAADSLNPEGNADSMIASCQQNFALLTTDGYWTTVNSSYDGNDNTGWEVGGTTRMGDHDDDQPRPYYDGPGVQNTTSAKSTGTLADVAMYYYKNDLRPPVIVAGKDVWADNVKPSGKDTANQQHMTTFTLGLGLEGILAYQSNYDSSPPPLGDYKSIVDGDKVWPVPDSNGEDEKALDDLWHAAVNGRGKFFSARDPNSLSTGLSGALASMSAVVGAGAAAATSNLQPVAGDQWAFTAEYKTVEWHGDVVARTIDLVSGAVATAPVWSAREKLDARTAASRSIYTLSTDAANFPSGLKPLTWTGAGNVYLTDTTLTAAEQAYFNPTQLALANGWNAGQSGAATAKSLVDFIRGDTSKEDTGNGTADDLYRDRIHILGDIVSAQPVYIKSPPFAYTDNGYAAYRAANAARRGTVYVAANDGMLHAFETDPDGNPRVQTAGISTAATDDDAFTGTNDGGDERWAYIPSRLLRSLYRLAENNYTHRWFADGTPIVEDACNTTATGSGSLTTPAFACGGASDWRAILVGGMNGGGRGYYALDITDPMNPKALWEFNARDPSVTACAATTALAVGETDDCDLGLTFGNPIMAKLPLGHAQSGRWVAIVSSGYNNVPGVDGSATNTGGDGNGYLYVLDAFSGRIIEKIQTCTGSVADPCGFVKLNAYHPLKDEKADNSPVRVYGTDIQGGVWRIDLSQQLSPRVHLVATLKDPSGTPQPITTPAELFLPTGLDTISYSNPWQAPAAVFVGTGRYLGTADRSDMQKQSIYAIKDIPGVTATLANARTALQSRSFSSESSMTVGSDTFLGRDLTGSCNGNPFTSSNGWFADFPENPPGVETGERVNVDSRIVATTLVMASNIPEVNSCTAGGSSWLNFIDVNTGCAVQGTTYASVKFPSSLIVGVSPIQIGDKVKTIVTTADNQQITTATPIGGGEFSGRRVQWRELLPAH